jgi:hypothetical protein
MSRGLGRTYLKRALKLIIIIMMDIESLKKKIIEQNYNLDDLAYKLNSPPAIFTTAEYSVPDQILSYQNGVFIESRVALHLAIILALSFFAALAIDVNTNSPRIRFIIALPILFGVLYLIYKNITSLHSQISIDFDGIVIKKNRYAWSDIFQTFIIDEANGHTGKWQPSGFYLVVVDDKGSILRFNITYLGTSPQTLAGIIEYFKKKRTNVLSPQ